MKGEFNRIAFAALALLLAVSLMTTADAQIQIQPPYHETVQIKIVDAYYDDTSPELSTFDNPELRLHRRPSGGISGVYVVLDITNPQSEPLQVRILKAEPYHKLGEIGESPIVLQGHETTRIDLEFGFFLDSGDFDMFFIAVPEEGNPSSAHLRVVYTKGAGIPAPSPALFLLTLAVGAGIAARMKFGGNQGWSDDPAS